MEFGTDKIVELGLVIFEYEKTSGQVGRALGSYDGLEDPGMAIPPSATAVHGITDEMVAGQKLNEEAIAQLMDGVALVIAHNAGFDRRFVEERLPGFARLPWACSFREIPWAEVGLGSGKLEYLAYQYGFFYDGHRAEIDCRALLEVLRRPLGGLWGSRGAGSEDLTTEADAALGGGATPERRGGAVVQRGKGSAGEDGVTALKVLLDRAREPTYRVWASGSPFETKDILKARQYRWDSDARCWWIEVPADGLEGELAWLKTAVFGGRNAVVDVDVLDARDRYSARTGKRERRGV